jgi:hypothetical protein
MSDSTELLALPFLDQALGGDASPYKDASAVPRTHSHDLCLTIRPTSLKRSIHDFGRNICVQAKYVVGIPLPLQRHETLVLARVTAQRHLAGAGR